MVKIALDDGHGMQTAGKRTPYIPELGRFVHENEFNKAVVNYLDIELKRCGFETLLVAPTDYDTPLAARTNLANSKRADAYISIHYDAVDAKFDGEGKDPEGHTVFVYLGQKDKGSGKLAECVLKYLNQGTPQKNRGIKEADFQVLRETNMIAILSENGFMDNKKEALWMVDPKFQKEVAIEHAKGICEYFGVAYKGAVVNTPTQPKQNPTPTKPKEEIDMPQKAVVIFGEADYATGKRLAARLSIGGEPVGVYAREDVTGKRFAKELYVVGGDTNGMIADKVVLLSGNDFYDTVAAVSKFVKGK
jgi:N-acetylmuramoyl-L-alanine amidase